MATGKRKYILVTGAMASSIERAVTDKLNSGWSLYGDPFFAEGRYCQAMVYGDAPFLFSFDELGASRTMECVDEVGYA